MLKHWTLLRNENSLLIKVVISFSSIQLVMWLLTSIVFYQASSTWFLLTFQSIKVVVKDDVLDRGGFIYSYVEVLSFESCFGSNFGRVFVACALVEP